MFKNIIGMSIFWCIVYNIGDSQPELKGCLFIASFLLIFIYSALVSEVCYPAYVSDLENSRGLMQLTILIINIVIWGLCFWKLELIA